MDDKKRKKILWMAILLFVIMGILFLVMLTSDKAVPDQQAEEQQNIESQPVFEPKSAEVEETIVAPSETNTEFSVRTLAMSYASRLGSWSTDNRGKNLQELLPLSTNSMKNYLNSMDLGEEAIDYNGITTKSLSAKIIYSDDEEAEVLVKTQRIEVDENLNENIYFQDITISLVYNGNKWLVSSAVWQ